METFRIDLMTEILHRLLKELALGTLQTKTVVLQALQHCCKVAKVIFVVFTSDQNVINVANDMRNSLKDNVHQFLEDSWC